MLFRGPMGGGAASGKIGAMIASHCAQGQYLKSRVKSTNPRSELQHVPRNALARLAAFWTEQLTAPQQAAWATYAANVTWLNRLGDTVHLSGQMEFIRSNAPRLQADVLYGDPFDFPLLGIVADAPTIFDRGDPGPTPTINMVPGNDYLTMVYDNTADWVTSDTSNAMLVYVAIPKNSSVSFFRRRTRLAGIVHASDATGAFNFLNQWLPAIAYRQKWTAWWAIARADGRLTRAVPVAPYDTGPPPPPPWIENFDYANGPINGQDSWTAPQDLFNAPAVAANSLQSVGSVDQDALCTSPLIRINWNSPWTLTLTVSRTLGDDTGLFLSFQPGHNFTAVARVQMGWSAGNGLLGIIDTISVNGPDSGNSLGSQPFAVNTPTLITLSWDGANLSISIAGGGTATAAQTTPLTGGAEFYIELDTTGTTASLTVDNIYLQQS